MGMREGYRFPAMLLSAIALVSLGASPKLNDLDRRLDNLCDRLKGRMGYCLKVLNTGETIGHREDERFPSASTIKTGVMLEAIRQVEEGKLKWTDKKPVPATREASMWSYHFKDGTTPNLDGWVNLMVTVSDNTATMVVRDWLGTMNVNRRLEQLGLPNTKILGNAPESEKLVRRLRTQFGMGMTTPKEMNRLLELIYRGQAASTAGCEKMIRILSHQYWDDWIGGSVPPGILCASKSGAINRSRSDTAIVFGPNPYILTIYTDSQKDQRWTSENEGDNAIIRIAGLVWNTLNPKMPYSPPAGYEKFVPTGGGVE